MFQVTPTIKKKDNSLHKKRRNATKPGFQRFNQEYQK